MGERWRFVDVLRKLRNISRTFPALEPNFPNLQIARVGSFGEDDLHLLRIDRPDRLPSLCVVPAVGHIKPPRFAAVRAIALRASRA